LDIDQAKIKAVSALERVLNEVYFGANQLALQRDSTAEQLDTKRHELSRLTTDIEEAKDEISQQILMDRENSNRKDELVKSIQSELAYKDVSTIAHTNTLRDLEYFQEMFGKFVECL
jgi:hypothetical protein